MKALIFLLMILSTSLVNSQKKIIELTSLDSIVYNKINDYRESIGSPKFKAFEDSSMRAFSYRVTRTNSTLEQIKHTDSCAYFHNVECVFRQRINTNISEYTEALANNDLEYFADIIVRAWINSPSHRHGISYDKYTIATVTTRITLDPEQRTAKLDASYHALSSTMGTKNGYVYKQKNPSKD